MSPRSINVVGVVGVDHDHMRDDGLTAGKKLPQVNPIHCYKDLGEMTATSSSSATPKEPSHGPIKAQYRMFLINVR